MRKWLPSSNGLQPYEPPAPKMDEKRVVRVAELDTIELASRELARAVERIKAVHWTLLELQEVDKICDEFYDLPSNRFETGLFLREEDVLELVAKIKEAIK